MTKKLITYENFKKNILHTKNNIILKKQYSNLNYNIPHKRKKNTFSHVFRKKNTYFRISKEKKDNNLSHLTYKNKIYCLKKIYINLNNEYNFFYNIKNKFKNSLNIEHKNKLNSQSTGIYCNNIKNNPYENSRNIKKNSTFYQFINGIKSFTNSTLKDNYLHIYPEKSPISLLSSVFSLELSSGKVWIQYPTIILNTIKKKKKKK